MRNVLGALAAARAQCRRRVARVVLALLGPGGAGKDAGQKSGRHAGATPLETPQAAPSDSPVDAALKAGSVLVLRRMPPDGAVRVPAENDAQELGRLVVGDHPPTRAPTVDPLQGPRRAPTQVKEAANDG
eukprot:11178527-Lingulodinium_polyedra.AAC.1